MGPDPDWAHFDWLLYKHVPKMDRSQDPIKMGPGLGPFFAHDYRGANQNGPNMVTVKTIHFLYLTHETIHFLYCSYPY